MNEVIEHKSTVDGLPRAIAVQQVTPMALLQQAVAQGVDTDKLAALMSLQERWEANEARKAFVVALNAFKADAPKILKTKEVSFGAGKTAYKHALAGVASELIGAALAEHDISHRWDVAQPDGGRIRVTCILTHALGHSERVTLEATPDTSGSKNSIQAIGSTVSYLQRYTLFAATGLVPKDADDDGAGSGPKQMDEGAKADWLSAIDGLADAERGAELWQKIATACAQVGDVATCEELRPIMAKKVKALRGGK